MKTLKFFLILMFLAVTGFIVFRSVNKKQVGYKTVNLEKRDIDETIFIPGNVFPTKEIEIKSQLSGILENIFVKIGDDIKTGNPVASIKIVPNTLDVERLESNLNLAKIEYEAVLIEYNRTKHLYEKHVIPTAEMNEAEKFHRLSKERLVSAENQLDIMRKGKISSKNISNMVTSSTNGSVIDIPVETGASVIERNNYNAGTTVAVVAETNIFKFRTLVAENYLRHVFTGDTIKLTFNAYENLTTKAVINKISSKGSLENGIMKYMMDAEFSVTPGMPVLRSGYSATAEIILNSRKQIMSIAEKYVSYANDSSYVYILAGKDKVRKTIKLGVSDGEYTEITDGLAIDDKVITNHDQID